MNGRSEIVHEAIQEFLVLGFAETGQVRVEGGNDRTFVSEINLNLAEVLPLFQQMGGVRMAQRMDVDCFLDAAGFEGQAEGALERGAGHRLGGGGSALAVVTFSGEEQRGMAMGLPLLAQEFERALR